MIFAATTLVVIATGFQCVFASVLGDAAAKLAPGKWTMILGTGGGFGSTFLETYGCNGANHSILQYAAKGAWDPKSQQFMFLGSPHGNPSKFILYRASDNAWREGPLPDNCFNQGHTCGGCNVHSYYLSGFDAAKGRFFFSYGQAIYAYSVAGNAWSRYADGQGYYVGMEWFPEMNGIVYCDGEGGTSKYLESTSGWSPVSGVGSVGAYHNVAVYSPAHKVVVFGGGNGSGSLYKINAAGQVSSIQSAPGEVRVCTSVLTVDPVSGNLLLLYPDNKFYEYDVPADAWKPLVSPPSVVGPTIGCGTGLVAAPVSTFGINLFVSYSPPMVMLYKHKASPSAAEGSRSAATVHLDIAGGAVYDLRGRRVAAGAGTARLSNGIYFMRGKMGEKTFIRRIAVAR